MKSKKIFFIISALIIPLILSACNFAFAPGGGSSKVTGPKGVYKSGNQGDTWLEQNTLEANATSIASQDIRQISFDIFDSNIIYRAANGGFFISQNNGDSWKKLNDLPINDFVLNPKTRGIIYFSTGNKVFKTTDNGENWTIIYAEAKANVTAVSLAISYFDTSYVYLLTSDGTLLLSDDWGESWQTIATFEKAQAKKVLVDPYNSHNIFVASQDKFYISNDQGKSWQETVFEQSKEMPGINKFKQLFFTQKPDNLIYLAGYGILKSKDNGQSWQPVTLITKPNTVDINALGFNPNETNELYYTIGSILYHTVDNGSNWKTKTLPIPAGAKVKSILIDPRDTNVLYLGVTQ
ncbi:hypothetical protein CO134_02880 [Candidatus Kuenenbacteria bacterium CG_4_9_14_3_um_filter_39_14]|uniref:Sortilin N-terminal domain-containing protein n=7 Tax=Candidatus Kueneniibacteriota TaxID=1752740 RepID=A0A2M7ILB9_9BACT|nr:MAG: hypothetical protein AUK13_02230 [Candidatus Kuenenbacteria bacterium CG2_30_39_24]PIP28886.1 MAG: hypothetical protein COX28_02180 [Candidatus Kuenenbacteria bacterium CG23_combo_of_CG06-09_8_20_14_all_39_39]PIR81169.1 MAG: hypothetical protein COU24_00040 [Candidatus Kuenenbacteria bacterium CG10_big_fil_rev_8_21_14_0_10_39_14]PIW95659.1 MAG: hypothetical protein COZ84_02315 [Candidatus Kuenenbacteria bacterium CG_4_8_14_3_um_filter_39_15]PJA91918.1 MAG: hypothetical protein CO134_028